MTFSILCNVALQASIHPFSKLLVFCRVTGMLEQFPTSRPAGGGTPWTVGQVASKLVFFYFF